MAKLIALRGIRNNFKAQVEGDLEHENHIHKGCIFTIGTDAQGADIPLSKLSKMDKADQVMIGQLNAAAAIGDASNPAVVTAVRAEAVAEAKAEVLAKASMKAAGSSADLASQLAAALKPAKP